MNAFRHLAAALGALALTFSAASAGRAATGPPATVNVINLPADNSAVLWYAEELGYFKDSGLDVKITSMTNAEAILGAIAGGGGEIGNSAVGTVSAARAKGIPVLFIAPSGLYDSKSPTAFLVTAKDSPIRKAAELSGKIVAVAGLGGLTHFATREWIDRNGGDSKNVKFVELPFPAMAAALSQHRVDAAYIVEPFYTAAANDVRVMGRAAEGVAPRYLATGWIATESWIASHADVALKFNVAIHRAAVWANGHHKESAAILLKYLKLDPALVERMNRVTYATALEVRLVQPPIDNTAKYTGQTPANANTLIWAPAK